MLALIPLANNMQRGRVPLNSTDPVRENVMVRATTQNLSDGLKVKDCRWKSVRSSTLFTTQTLERMPREVHDVYFLFSS